MKGIKNARRALAAVCAVSLAPLVIPSAPTLASPGFHAAKEHRDYFPVPDAALVRSLGDVDPGTCAPAPAAQVCQGAEPSAWDAVNGNYPMSVPGLGIPVGGFGAGSFMINQSGTFGPWNFGGQQGSSWETRILPQAAFHVREEVGSGPANVRTLATKGPQRTGTQGPVPQRSWGSPLPAWSALQPGEGSYAALYPFGWMNYKPFKTDVSMRFFSPIVAKEDRRTSLPVVYFDVRIANHTRQRAKMSVMFTMPNAPAHVSGTRADPTAPQGPDSIRRGFSSRHENRDGVQAITLSADDAANTPDSARSEWSIAARPQPGQKVTYTNSWNADGDGSDVYAPFSTNGELPDKALDNSASAGAVSVSADLSPGQVTTIPFALAWDFPQVGFHDNDTIWMRRYTDFYGAKENAQNEYIAGSYPGHQSFAIARDALTDRDAALRAVQRWWRPIATNQAYPRILRTSALNELSMLAFNNSFWEGGLVGNSVVPTGFDSAGPGRHLGASQPGSHLFGVQDTGAGGLSGMGRTTDIQTYGYRGYFSLFPNLFRGTLAASAEATKRASNRNAPDLYVNTPDGDPFITWGNSQDAEIQGGTDSRPPKPGTTQWVDSPSKYIFEWYAYAKMTGDRAMLRTAWPAIKDEIAYLKGVIPAGTHLPVDPNYFANIYNGFPQTGPGLYNSQLYLLALTSAIAAGERLGADHAYVAGLRTDLATAKVEFEKHFWDPSKGYYHTTSGGELKDTVFADSFFAQHLAEDVGLPDLIDPAHHRMQLMRQYAGLRVYNSDGEMTGAVTAAPPGEAPAASGSVFTGSNYLVAADLYQTGARVGSGLLKGYGAQLGSAIAYQTWMRADNGFAFNPPDIWRGSDPHLYNYPAYSQSMGVWDLIDAIKPIGTK